MQDEHIVVVRSCTGQGYDRPCSQTYDGKLIGNAVRGTWTMGGVPMGDWELTVP